MHRPLASPATVALMKAFKLPSRPAYAPPARKTPRPKPWHTGERWLAYAAVPDEVREVLRQTYVADCAGPMPHVSPDLPIDVLVTALHDDTAYKEECRMVHAKTYNFTHCVRERGFRVIGTSVALVRPADRNGRYRLLAMFLTDVTDPRMGSPRGLGMIPRVWTAVSGSVCQKTCTRWNSRTRLQGRVTENTSPGCRGTLFNDGLMWYRSHVGSHFGYFMSRAEATFGDAYQRVVGVWCACIHAFERAHAPGVASHRLSVAKRHKVPSVILGAPVDVAPAHVLGISQGFCNNVHGDSTSKGMTETIGYHRGPRPLDTGDPGTGWGFAIWLPRVIFDLNRRPHSMVYVPGREPHATLPTGAVHKEHQGYGAVIFSRSSVLQENWRRFRSRFASQRDVLRSLTHR